MSIQVYEPTDTFPKIIPKVLYAETPNRRWKSMYQDLFIRMVMSVIFIIIIFIFNLYIAINISQLRYISPVGMRAFMNHYNCKTC